MADRATLSAIASVIAYHDAKTREECEMDRGEQQRHLGSKQTEESREKDVWEIIGRKFEHTLTRGSVQQQSELYDRGTANSIGQNNKPVELRNFRLESTPTTTTMGLSPHYTESNPTNRELYSHLDQHNQHTPHNDGSLNSMHKSARTAESTINSLRGNAENFFRNTDGRSAEAVPTQQMDRSFSPIDGVLEFGKREVGGHTSPTVTNRAIPYLLPFYDALRTGVVGSPAIAVVKTASPIHLPHDNSSTSPNHHSSQHQSNCRHSFSCQTLPQHPFPGSPTLYPGAQHAWPPAIVNLGNTTGYFDGFYGTSPKVLGANVQSPMIAGFGSPFFGLTNESSMGDCGQGYHPSIYGLRTSPILRDQTIGSFPPFPLLSTVNVPPLSPYNLPCSANAVRHADVRWPLQFPAFKKSAVEVAGQANFEHHLPDTNVSSSIEQKLPPSAVSVPVKQQCPTDGTETLSPDSTDPCLKGSLSQSSRPVTPLRGNGPWSTTERQYVADNDGLMASVSSTHAPDCETPKQADAQSIHSQGPSGPSPNISSLTPPLPGNGPQQPGVLPANASPYGPHGNIPLDPAMYHNLAELISSPAGRSLLAALSTQPTATVPPDAPAPAPVNPLQHSGPCFDGYIPQNVLGTRPPPPPPQPLHPTPFMNANAMAHMAGLPMGLGFPYFSYPRGPFGESGRPIPSIDANPTAPFLGLPQYAHHFTKAPRAADGSQIIPGELFTSVAPMRIGPHRSVPLPFLDGCFIDGTIPAVRDPRVPTVTTTTLDFSSTVPNPLLADDTVLGQLVDSRKGNAPLLAAMLAHPDEFKNPSSFLKVYGDPACVNSEARPAPKKGRDGNWECPQCQNVNYPRRFRCNRDGCGTERDKEGDRIVSEYARVVYSYYIMRQKNVHQQSPRNLTPWLNRTKDTSTMSSCDEATTGSSQCVTATQSTDGWQPTMTNEIGRYA